jgi:hypothetical protein
MSTPPLTHLQLLEYREGLKRSDYLPGWHVEKILNHVKWMKEQNDRILYERDEARRDRDAFISRVVAADALHEPNGFQVFGRTYCKTCGKDGGEFPCATSRALDGEGDAA